ncbi:hypothetical protein HF086_006146 [Spodoptera exigua]|uniref:Aminotransferase class I/classII large domain-containing protein n=1 Tax=Spodoptera exigua TaxID=7107 RepID=A0A922SMZ7_SPOEX|nr:hypothetical protein HF086_006146 [Spodoptera exigua]
MLFVVENEKDSDRRLYTENTNASTTEKESEQLSPIVDSGATVADDEKSNIEDLSSIFGDFDKEQSTSTASTSSKIICLFCDRSQKRCGKKLINLTFPSSDKVPQQIKDMAKNFGDLEILSKLQHQTIAYHLPCYAVYQSKEKRSMEESTDSSYSKYRQLHQLAFQSISNFIETEIIENNKVMYLAQLFLRYQALLGTEEYLGIMGAADIICSTLGKAVSGAAGGYTTGPKELITLLRNVSRPYLFSNAPPPPVVCASIKSLDIVEQSGELRQRLRENTRAFRDGLKSAGLMVAGDDHPICPVMVGDAPLAVELAANMLKHGIYVVAFSYPVVPKGAARVRVQLSAAHTQDDVARAVQAFADVAKEIGIVKA